jgi:hypothetical protein
MANGRVISGNIFGDNTTIFQGDLNGTDAGMLYFGWEAKAYIF